MFDKNLLISSDYSEISDLELSIEIFKIKDDIKEIKDLKDNIIELEDINISLENIVTETNDNIDQEKYFYISNHLSDISKRTGLDFKIPSVSEYDGDFSTEGIKEVVNKLKNAAKVFKDKLFEKIKNVYSRIKKALENTSDKIKRLSNKVKTLDDKPKTEKIKISLNGLVASNQTFKDFKNNLNNSVIEVKNYRENGDLIASIALSIKSIAVTLEKCIKEKEIKPLIPDLISILKNFFKEDIEKVKTKSDNGDISTVNVEDEYKIEKYGSLLGNNAIYGIYPKNNFDITITSIKEDLKELKEYTLNSGVRVLPNTGKKDEIVEEIDVLSKKDIQGLLDTLEDIYNYVIDMDKDLVPEITSLSDVMSSLDNLFEVDFSDDTKIDAGTIYGYVEDIALEIDMKLLEPRILIAETVVSNIPHVLNFCEKNIKAYDSGKENE